MPGPDFALDWGHDPGHHLRRQDRCRVRARPLGARELPGAGGRRRRGRGRRRHAAEPGRGGAAGFAVEDLREADWSRFAALVLAPGVPLTHPEPHWVVRKAKAAGVEIIGDVELFAASGRRARPEAPFVAITGTNGKSTTTALTPHILQVGRTRRADGRQHRHRRAGAGAAGAGPLPRDRDVVVPDRADARRWSPRVGILLNVTPDHLDRHGTMEAYAGLKARLVPAAGTPSIGDDDDWCRDIAERLRLADRSWVDLVSARSRVAHGWYAIGSTLVGARALDAARSAPSPISPASARCAAGTTSRTRWPPVRPP